MSDCESEKQISKEEKEKQLSLKIEQIKIRNEELLNKKKMIEEDIRVSQESDKVSNESDFTRNSRVEEQANIKSNPDETKESFSNINKKKTKEKDDNSNEVASQKTLENEKIDKWKKEREEVDKERVNRCQKAGSWVREWDKFKGCIDARPNNADSYDASLNKKHNKNFPAKYKSDKFMQEKDSDAFPEKKNLDAEGSTNLTVQETQWRAQKSNRHNQASHSKGKNDHVNSGFNKTSNTRRQRYYRRNLSGSKRGGKKMTNDFRSLNTSPNNQPFENIQHKSNSVKKVVKFEDEILNKENNATNRRDDDVNNKNRKSKLNYRNDYKANHGLYYSNNLAYPNNQKIYQQYRYYDKYHQLKQYQFNQCKQNALKNSYYFKGFQYFPQQYYNYQQQYLLQTPKNYYQQSIKYGGDMQQHQFNRFPVENNYNKPQFNVSRNLYQQFKMYNSYYDQRFIKTNVNQAYHQQQYRQNYMNFNQRNHNSPHQKPPYEQDSGSDAQRKSSPGSGRFVTSPWRRQKKNKKSSYSNYYSNSPRVFNAQSQQNWIVSKKQETQYISEGGHRAIKKEGGQTEDKTQACTDPRVEARSVNKGEEEGVRDASLKHANDNTKRMGDKEFEESKEKTKVVASFSDIIIKKDAEKYLNEKDLNSMNDEDPIEEISEEKNEEYNEEDDDDEQWEDIDEIIGIQLDHGLNTYEHADNGVYYEEQEEETQVHRLNRSDESFHQFIIDNTLNIDSAQMLALNKRSTSMLMLPTSSMHQPLPLPGQLISQLSYPDVLDWSDNVEASAFLPSQREDAYNEDEDDDGFDEDERTMSKEGESDEDNNDRKVGEFSNEILKSSEGLENQGGMKLKDVSNVSEMRVDECGGGDARMKRG